MTDLTAGAKTIVSIDYTLRDEDGKAVESSEDSGPMAYLHGAGNIIPGLEKALAGRSAGDEVTVTVAPEEGYGLRDEGLIQRVSMKRLGGGKFEVGQVLRLRTEQGVQMVRVLKVGRFNVDLDANHPLAGRTLNFEVAVRDVREATAEEIAHGHAHGPGGHDHDES